MSDQDVLASLQSLSAKAINFLARMPNGQVSNADFLHLRQLALNRRNGPQSPAMVLLSDLLAPNLAEIHADFSSYYALDPQAVMYQIGMAFQWAVEEANPEIIMAAAERGINWGIHLCEVIKISVWGSLYQRHLNMSALDDQAFRSLFEAEWADLMRYRGLRYNFRVIPKLSLEAFIRYQELKRGDLIIRQVISSYLAHEGKEHPYFIQNWAPKFGEVAFARRLRRSYEPLIRLTAKHALDNLEAKGSDQVQLLPDMLEQARGAFDRAWEAFEFHVAYRGEPSPWVRRGILGLAEDANFRGIFDGYLQTGGASDLGIQLPADKGILKSTDLTPILFSVFIRRRLVTWLHQNYPSAKREPQIKREPRMSSQRQSLVMERQTIDEAALWQETPAVASSEGKAYLTVEQASRRYGVSVRQLQYADRRGRLTALRAGSFPGVLYVETGLSPAPDLRLYPATEAAAAEARLALAKVAARASDLAGEELTRVAAASYLEVSVDTLRHLEQQGLVVPVAGLRAKSRFQNLSGVPETQDAKRLTLHKNGFRCRTLVRVSRGFETCSKLNLIVATVSKSDCVR